MSNLTLADETIRISNWSTAFKVFAWIGIICSVAIFVAWTFDSARFTEFLRAIGVAISLFATSSLFSAISAIMEHLAHQDNNE